MKKFAVILLSLLIAPTSFAGAWGEGNFENDDALDWIAECTQASNIAPVSDALNAALKSKYIEANQGSTAIVAAEVVAASLGKPSAKLPPELQSWVRRIPPEQLKRLAPNARKALARIKDPKLSELKQLWSEGKSDNWVTVIVELETRLGK